MTLGRRTFLLIFPIVLAGYLLAAFSTYVAQSNSLMALERARLSQQLDHVSTLFRTDLMQSRSFLYSVIEGDAIRRFISEPDASYRNNALGVRLQDNIRSLIDDPLKFVSFAIISPDLDPTYYFETSSDPFATISAQQMTLAHRLTQSADVRDWTYLHDAGTRPVIVYSEFIDPISFARPVQSAKKGSILVQVAVKPDQFLDMLDRLTREYGTEASFASEPRVWGEDQLAASVRLAPQLFLNLQVKPGYVSDMLSRLKILLALGALAMSLVSIGIMIWLIRRFITNPISLLDQQVTAVMNKTSDRIESRGSGLEVRRLTGNIKKMHNASVQALTLVQKTSWTDSLTGICNRGRFNTLAAEAIQHAITRQEPCSLLFIDIDNFKFVNDKYGHDVGDALLRTLAGRIERLMIALTQAYDLPPAILARLSGDEFAVVLSQGAHGEAPAEAACKAIVNLFDGQLDVDGKYYPVTASIGVAICPDDAQTLAELVSNADAAMYQAKTNGRNQSARFSRALQDKRNRIRQIQEELRNADLDEEFHLVYMPIVDAHDRVMGCEALLRWNSPVLGTVGPDEFMPIAESSGSFRKIDWWVIDKAMSQHAALQALFGPDTVLAINISSAELHSKSITQHLTDSVMAHNVDPFLIEIELTETFAVTLGDLLHRNIEALRDAGFRISIDDFGAGYTSMQQIIEYTANTIKLDRALVEKLTSGKTQSLLKAMIGLCHAQKMDVIAEGVDNAEKLSKLRAAGCDLFQGYFIAKPQLLEELAEWHRRRTAPQVERLQRPAKPAAGI